MLAVEKIVQSKLLVKGANRRIMSLDNHVGMVSELAVDEPWGYVLTILLLMNRSHQGW